MVNPTNICGIYVFIVDSGGFAAPSMDKSTLQVLNVEKKQLNMTALTCKL